MNAYVVSLIRTGVALAVGVLLTWAATTLKIVVDPSSKAGLVAATTGAVTGLYYALARWLEHRWPKLGVLLGIPLAPSYAKPAVAAPKGAGGFASPGWLTILVGILVVLAILWLLGVHFHVNS